MTEIEFKDIKKFDIIEGFHNKEKFLVIDKNEKQLLGIVYKTYTVAMGNSFKKIGELK